MVANNISNMINSVSVPTIFEKPTATVNIQGMTPSDLDALKSADPFLYHSIQAAMASDAAGDVSQEDRSSPNEVTRKTRFSFEIHPDKKLLEDFDAAAAAASAPREKEMDSSDMATEPIPTSDTRFEGNTDHMLLDLDFIAGLMPGQEFSSGDLARTGDDDRLYDQVLSYLFTRDNQ